MAMNRAELLIELIQKNGSADIETFDMIIPDFYAELYSLYSILKDSDVLDSCRFNHQPSVSEMMLTVTVTIPKKDGKKFITYVDEADSRIHYLKNDPFDLQLKQKGTEIAITFVRPSPD